MGKCHRELPHLYSTDLCLQSRIHESKQEPGGNSTNTDLKHYELGTKQWWWSYDLDLIKRPWVMVGTWQNLWSWETYMFSTSLWCFFFKKKLTDSGHENAIIFGNSTLTLVKWPQVWFMIHFWAKYMLTLCCSFFF